MTPFALTLLLVVLDRLLTSGWLRSRPIGRGWRRGRGSAFAYMRSAPATYAYLFVLLITTWVLQTSSATIANRLLLERSTNLHHLAHDPVRVLVSSAFWLSSGSEFVVWLVLLSFVSAPFERRLGSGRTITVFALGHICATLLTAAGLWAALRVDLVQHSIVNAKDVGASYGFFALAACLSFVVYRRLRVQYLVALIGLIVATAAISATFTDFGHLLAVAVGLACYPLVRNKAVGEPFGAGAAALIARRRGDPTPQGPISTPSP